MLLNKAEQVTKLVRSKDVGVWFISQNPSNIPGNIPRQLDDRVQHTLCTFTSKNQKAVKATVQTMHPNPAFDTKKAVQELGTGEMLILFPDMKGDPSVVKRAMAVAPCSRMELATKDGRNGLVSHSPMYSKYKDDADRGPAHEIL